VLKDSEDGSVSKNRSRDGASGRERRKKIRWDPILATPACSIEVLQILRDFFHSDLPPSSDPEDLPKIKLSALPVRLFKALSRTPSDHSPAIIKDHADQLDQAFRYIHLLLTEYGTSPDKFGGYPLARSVLSGNLAFVRLLLDHGARPGIKDNLVIMVAIETGDLELLRLLIEPNFIHPKETSQSSPLIPNSRPLKNHKKLKLEDRVQITDQMLEQAIKRKDAAMAQYFINKGLFS
jgi:hypothetical protein